MEYFFFNWVGLKSAKKLVFFFNEEGYVHWLKKAILVWTENEEDAVY